MPMTAFTRGSLRTPGQHTGACPSGGAQFNAALQEALPPAAVSAVTVPRECPMTPARDTSTRSPNQPGSLLRTKVMSLTRSAMLDGTSDLEQSARPGTIGRGANPSL